MLAITFCLTDLVPSPENRNTVGYFFIGVIALNICTHLFFLFSDIFVKLYHLILDKCTTKKVKKGVKTKAEGS